MKVLYSYYIARWHINISKEYFIYIPTYSQYNISFTLYPAHRMGNIGNLVLRHYVLPLSPYFSRHCVERWVAKLNARVLSRCQSEEIKILRNNYAFFRVGIEPTSPAARRPINNKISAPAILYFYLVKNIIHHIHLWTCR